MPRKQKNKYKDGRFCVRLDIGRDDDGKRKRLPFYGLTLEEAEAKRDAYIRTHPAKCPVESRGMTFQQWADKWIEVYKSGTTQSTQDTYKVSVNAIMKYEYEGAALGGMKLTDIRPYHMQALFSSLKDKSKSFIHSCYITANQIFTTAKINNIIAEIPLEGIRLPKGSYTGYRVIEEWERDIITQHWQGHRAGKWAMLMLYCGLRKGEMAALRSSRVDKAKLEISVTNSIDFKHNEVKDPKTKAGERMIPILPPLAPALDDLPVGDDFLCKAVTGEPLTEAAYRRGWNSFMMYCERAANDLKPYDATRGWRREKCIGREGYREFHVSAHDLRYTYASMLYDADIDVKTAQELLGHEDIRTTLAVYTHLSDRKKKRSIDKLYDFFLTEI